MNARRAPAPRPLCPWRVPAALLWLAAGACFPAQAAPAADDAAGWRAAAEREAGADLRPAFDQFCRTGPGPNLDAVEIPPLRAFDNLVFLGRAKWNSWALLTSEGIILFDALETEAEVERYVIGGLAALGLDPATIRHVVVMHGHGDHFGGARLLQQRYGAKVWLSEADGELMRSAEARGELRPGSTIPTQDGTIADGDTLSLGDTNVRFYLTPGHTPGTLSALLPLRAGNAAHVGGYWGGTGFAPGRADYPAYFASLDRFRRIAGEAGTDVALSNHPTNDMTMARLPRLVGRAAEPNNPLVLGRDGYQRFLATLEGCVHATYAAADPELPKGIEAVKKLFAFLAANLLAASAAGQIAAVEPAPAIGVPFGAAKVAGSPQSVDLAAAGYVEREHFLRGSARAGPANAPVGEVQDYVTRILVRMPADPARWSGVLHIEPIHPQQGGTTHWWVIQPWMMARGDAYIAVSAGDDEPTRRRSAGGPPINQSAVSRWFNPERYQALRWPEEDGIRFALMADLVARLRSSPAPILPRPPRTVLAAGWSYTGSFWRTYINGGFHDVRRGADGGRLIDGYLIGISSRWNGQGVLPLAADLPRWPEADERRALKPIDAPVIEFITEFEVGAGSGAQRPDVDRGIGAHRLYELGGVIHGDALLPGGRAARLLRPNLVQLASRDYPADRLGANEPVCPLPSSDLPHGALARAATANLLRWAEGGSPPPRAPQLTLDGAQVIHDANGNPVGGVRPAELVLPLATYGAYRGADRPECASSGGRPLFVTQPFTPAEARRLYGTKRAYMDRYCRELRRQVRDGWILESDVPALVAAADARAGALLP